MTAAVTTPAFLQEAMDTAAEGDRLKLCLQCGSCSGICPFGFAMDYPPRKLIAALRAEDIDSLLESDTAWLCVSCFACASVCPSQIPLPSGVLATLKSKLLLKGEIPQELQTALANARRYGNALGESPRKRADWARDFTTVVPVMAQLKKPVDVLWYVGDYPSYHARVQHVARAMAKIFAALKVSFGILGPEEVSDGDVQSFVGERGLFELLALKNGKAFGKYKFKRIVTTDPHAFNSFTHEYPKVGIDYPVQHHTQFLHDHLEELRPMFNHKQNLRVAYHDPCYLGRANDNNIYDEPRELLKAIPGVSLVEMPHSRDTTICCGGGGGGMWLDGFSWEKCGVRSTDWRVKEAMSVGANVLAVACPYEAPRFEDSVKNLGQEGALMVKDIAELMADAIFG